MNVGSPITQALSCVPTNLDLLRLIPYPRPAGLLIYREIVAGSPAVGASLGRVRCLLSIDVVEGRDWYHVSASVPGTPIPRAERRRLERKHGAPAAQYRPALPTWAELSAVRKALFQPFALVVQVFPPEEEWASEAEVLHLWQRLGEDRLIPDLRRKGGRL